ncbi:hypothetical protein AAHE18_08G023500 [Arachis hypogaea]
MFSLFPFSRIMLSPNRLMKLLIPSLACSLCVALHPSFNSPRFWDLLPRPTIAPPPFPFFSNCNPGFCKFQSFTVIQSQTEQSFIRWRRKERLWSCIRRGWTTLLPHLI